MATAACPECGSRVEVQGSPTRGQRVRCSDCGTTLRVINLEPLDLTWTEDYWEEEEEDD